MNCSSKIALTIFASLMLAMVVARAETAYWSDNFETNAGSRWTTNSVWQIGAPTIGPSINAAGYRTFSGSHCATTGLKSGAPAGVDRRLICTNYNGSNYLTIPAANQTPRLRFWQWFNFVNGEGFVEIQQAGTTNWQTISMTNNSLGNIANTGGGIWSRPSLDLSAYAGQNVQIAFHFISGGDYGTDLGWYVDDVSVVTSPPKFNYFEGFETGLGDWSVDSGTWEVGIPTSGPSLINGFRAHSGTNCAATILGGNYDWYVDTRLISPPFVVPASGTPVLRFWQWYSLVNAATYVEVNSSMGFTNFTTTTNYITATNIAVITNIITYTNVISYTNIFVTMVTNISTVTNVASITNIFNTGTNITTVASIGTNNWQTISLTNNSLGSAAVTSNGQWTNSTIDLSAFAGQSLQVAFHFRTGAAGYGSASGWYVDDVAVVSIPTLTLPASKTIISGQTFTATAAATNSSLPGAKYIFGLAAVSTNAFVTTNGVLTWTNTQPPVGTNTLAVKVADDSTPSFLLTNNFNVIVWPAFNFSAARVVAGQQSFRLILQSITNTTWRIDASTNLASWLPVYTNLVGSSGLLLYTDLLATNFPHRFYRAVYP